MWGRPYVRGGLGQGGRGRIWEGKDLGGGEAPTVERPSSEAKARRKPRARLGLMLPGWWRGQQSSKRTAASVAGLKQTQGTHVRAAGQRRARSQQDPLATA